MDEKELHIASKRMLKLIDNLKANGTIKYRQDFLDTIDMPKQRFRQIAVLKKQNFTLEHIHSAAKYYSVNINWLFGFEKDMYRKK